MRKIIFIAIACTMAACSSTTEKTAEVKATTADTTATKATAVQGKIDPVCEMPYDKTWTDMTIYNGDTIMFCSDNCKKAFEARPTKYAKHS